MTPPDPWPLTIEEYQAEYEYILDERRGMLSPDSELTPEQEAYAVQETEEYMAKNFTVEFTP